MTQEILDYLLIKAQFLTLTEEELLQRMETKENYETYCNIICIIMGHDIFFFSSPELLSKLERVLTANRFSHSYSSETIQEYNSIIVGINQYHALSENQKQEIEREFIIRNQQERCLPYQKIITYPLDFIYERIRNDYVYAKMILKEEENLEIENDFAFMSTINFLLDFYPTLFLDEQLLEKINIILLLVDDKKNFHYSQMVKKAKKRRKKIEKCLNDINDPKILKKSLKK